MANPIVHSESSVHHFGGNINDYIAIHEKMDCSKAWMADGRHRVLTHTMFWIKEVMIPIFGSYITNSDDKKVSVKDICERHILEDYKMKFIPTPQDFIQEMDMKNWMQNGNGVCPSAEKLYKSKKLPSAKDNLPEGEVVHITYENTMLEKAKENVNFNVLDGTLHQKFNIKDKGNDYIKSIKD